MVYKSSFLTPYGTSIDARYNNSFSAQINGNNIINYTLQVLSINNVVVYTSGLVNIAANPLFDKDILDVIVPANSLVNGNTYKWKLTVGDGVNSVTSREILFFAYKVPTVSVSIPETITSRSFEFVGSYSQENGIPVRTWRMELVDADYELLESSGDSYSGNIRYSVDSLVNGRDYSLILYFETETGYKDTQEYNFTVSYDESSSTIKPTATSIQNLGAMEINWANPVVINGDLIGTHNFNSKIAELYSLRMMSDASLEYEVDIPPIFTMSFIISIKDYVGGRWVFCRLLSDDEPLEIGYDTNRFFYVKGDSEQITREIDWSDADYFLVVIRPTYVSFTKFNGADPGPV